MAVWLKQRVADLANLCKPPPPANQIPSDYLMNKINRNGKHRAEQADFDAIERQASGFVYFTC